jgi:hypothetical protein
LGRCSRLAGPDAERVAIGLDPLVARPERPEGIRVFRDLAHRMEAIGAARCSPPRWHWPAVAVAQESKRGVSSVAASAPHGDLGILYRLHTRARRRQGRRVHVPKGACSKGRGSPTPRTFPAQQPGLGSGKGRSSPSSDPWQNRRRMVGRRPSPRCGSTSGVGNRVHSGWDVDEPASPSLEKRSRQEWRFSVGDLSIREGV